MDNLQHFRDTLRTLIDEIVADEREHPLNRLHTWAKPVNDAAAAAGLPQVVHIESCKGLPGNASSVTIRDAFTINRLLAEQTLYRAHPETGRTIHITTEEPKGGIVSELRRWLTVRPEQVGQAAKPAGPVTLKQMEQETLEVLQSEGRSFTAAMMAQHLHRNEKTCRRYLNALVGHDLAVKEGAYYTAV